MVVRVGPQQSAPGIPAQGARFIVASSGVHQRSPTLVGHAVVVGGGMAGLLTARVLTHHVARVTLIERDALPDSAQHRKGVPQGRMLHVLLPRGREIVERLFPGYSRDLEAAGAVPLRVPADGLLLGPAGWLDRRARGWPLLSASRPLFEGIVRRRLRELPSVTILDRHDVISLLTSPEDRGVIGVKLRPLENPGTIMPLEADLVVDASGRGSRAPQWLAEAGYAVPTATHVDPDIAYACRVYRIPEGFRADWKLVMLTSAPSSRPCAGYLFPIEDRQWMVGLIGAAGQHPPTDEDGFAAFARGLRHPVIAEALAAAEPLTPIRSYRGTANRVWHYERLRRWPERFIVLGDALCALNPLYAQGMSTAAIAAQAVDGCLREHRRRHPIDDLDGLARRCQRRLAQANADPWLLSTREDLRYPTTTGMSVSPMIRLIHRHLDRVVAAATHDPTIAERFLQVVGLMTRSTSLFTPRVLLTTARAQPPDPRTLPSSAPPARPPIRTS